MFSSLRQGNIVYILDKSNKLSLKTGQVANTNGGQLTFGTNVPSLVNMTVDVEGSVMEFNNLPALQSVCNYNNGKLIIAETKEVMNTEVENLINNSKNILDNIEYHKDIVNQGEEILKLLNPQFAKDKARDEEIASLRNKVEGVEDKLGTIIDLLQKKEN